MGFYLSHKWEMPSFLMIVWFIEAESLCFSVWNPLDVEVDCFSDLKGLWHRCWIYLVMFWISYVASAMFKHWLKQCQHSPDRWLYCGRNNCGYPLLTSQYNKRPVYKSNCAFFYRRRVFSEQDNCHVWGLLHRWAAVFFSIRPDWLLQLRVLPAKRRKTSIASGAPRGKTLWLGVYSRSPYISTLF